MQEHQSWLLRELAELGLLIPMCLDVNFHSSLTVLRSTTEKIVVAFCGDGNGVIAGGIGFQRCWRIAGLVHPMGYSQHIVILCVILKNCTALCINIKSLFHQWSPNFGFRIILIPELFLVSFWSLNYVYVSFWSFHQFYR